MSGPYLQANGQHVTEVNLLVPYRGIPVADIALAGSALLSGAVSLTVGNLTHAMTVQTDPASGKPRSRAFAGVTRARLVGGAGGWSRVVTLPPYRAPGGVMRSKVLADVALAVGEKVTLAKGIDGSLGNFYCTEPGATAGKILGILAGALWWVDKAGMTQVASVRPSSTIGTPATIGPYDADAGFMQIATEDPAAWMPGATYIGPMVPNGVMVLSSRIVARSDGKMRIEALVS